MTNEEQVAALVCLEGSHGRAAGRCVDMMGEGGRELRLNNHHESYAACQLCEGMFELVMPLGDASAGRVTA
jgi:hypothetical protein